MFGAPKNPVFMGFASGGSIASLRGDAAMAPDETVRQKRDATKEEHRSAPGSRGGKPGPGESVHRVYGQGSVRIFTSTGFDGRGCNRRTKGRVPGGILLFRGACAYS